MLESLPERISPLRMARGGESLDGRISVARMSRLRALLVDGEAQAAVRLRFDSDDAGRARIDGRVTAELLLTCQRCLQPVLVEVSSDLHLALVTSDAAAESVQEPYEPLLLKQEPVSLPALVEDELLLALPIVALHREGTCRSPLETNASPGSDETQRPFAALKEMVNRT